MHVISAVTAGGLIACAILFAKQGRLASDAFLLNLSLACVLMAMTQFANAVPGWLRGDVEWIYLPRLAGFLVIIRQILKTKLIR